MDEAEMIVTEHSVVVRRARLVRQLQTWNERTAWLFAADCAEHVLHLYTQAYPNDSRPRDAIAASRAYAKGMIAAAAWDAARAAAWDAARDAATAAWDAQLAAEMATARDVAAAKAAREAAYAAAMAADWDTDWDAAQSAAWLAAVHAARAAAWAAARDDAQTAERKWQTKRLFDYLEGRV